MSSCSKSSQVDTALRGMAGVAILISVVLTHYHSPNWMWFTVFVGVNLLQSAFTNWCPAMMIFRRVFKLEG
jgi:hypothetical protein